MMIKINIDALEKGDIILTTSTRKKPSGVIKKVTNSDISHAMIYASYASAIDSTGEGVHARSLQKELYDDSCSLYVLRMKEQITSQQLSVILDYARSQIGTRYSVTEAANSVIKGVRAKAGGKRQYCSRMIARAYAEAGVFLVNNADYCTPEDLKQSALLKFVDTPALDVDDDELDWIRTEEDTTQGMRDVTNELLLGIRKLDESIEHVGQINELIIKRPELDAKVAELLKSSGYLDYWRVETKRFPWRYDPVEMYNFSRCLEYRQALKEYCIQTIEQHKNGDLKHWELNAAEYERLYERYSSQTFYELAALYKTLQNLNYERFILATMVLTHS